MPENPPFAITRTIYDPAIKDFVFDSGDGKALPNIKEWLNSHNPMIYWYVLRIDNLTDSDISQWAVELYTHPALTISEAYIDGFDKILYLEKYRRDAYSKPYLLSITKDKGIPIVSKGTRRLYFKIDINCREGLMHEYVISSMFMAHGFKEDKIKEKKFQYSCKVGEFRQIFDSNPDEASIYAEKRLKGKYSSNSIHIFTNSFRMIHELSRYCHSGSVRQEGLISKLQTLHANFEKVPEITGEHIIPLIRYEMDQLNSVKGRNEEALTPGTLNLCDKLVEYLHMEVMGAADDMLRKEPANAGQKECPMCSNVITESNKSLICMKCRSRFCLTCEEWFRVERKRGEKPLCEKCFSEEHEKERRAKEEQEEQEIQRREKELSEQDLREKLSNLYEKGVHASEAGDWEVAIATFEKIVKIDHKYRDSVARLSLAAAERQSEEEEKKEKEGTESRERERLRGQEDEHKKRKDIPETLTNSIGMKFVLIPAGEFMMGSKEFDFAKPIHKVKINIPFYLSIYPVTQREWNQVMANNPSNFKGDDFPVDSISWNSVQEFINKLNKKEGAYRYRLPSEAEWEYVARAGTAIKYTFGHDESKDGKYAYFVDRLGGKTYRVGQKKPNPWGLFDMYGNVYEWVQDIWQDNYVDAPTNGSPWERKGKSSHVIRSGGWRGYAGANRVLGRDLYAPGISRNLGFRLLRNL